MIDELNLPFLVLDLAFASSRSVQLIVVKKKLVIVYCLHEHSLTYRFVKDNARDKKHDYVADR